jgi:2-amino-4-hydroxy-6-hydroxymethyldihydropteridine diphosphokinase
MSSPNPYAIDSDTLSGMKPLSKVVYSVGSNLGDRLANIQGAVDAIRDTPDVIVVAVSGVYETDAVGGPDGSPSYLNLVIVAETTLEPRTLLERAQAIEDAYGRVREEHWGPRTLDVDLIMVGKNVTAEADLTVPHPLAHERGFVLVPWLEIDPAGTLPGKGPIDALAGGVDTSGVRRRDDLQVEGD